MEKYPKNKKPPSRVEKVLDDMLEKYDGIKPQKKDSLTMKDYYFDVSSNQFERRDNPPPHVSNSEREPKIHSAAYRRKYPDRYKKGYVAWYDRTKPERIVTTPLPENKKINFKTDVKPTHIPAYIPQRIEEIPAPSLEITPDPDLTKGIGSFFPAKK